MNTWEQASYTAIEINNNIISKFFVVPPYQRGYVWSEKQKEQFIDTLKRGLPFGTILLYRDEKENKYQIIDGLQRCTTIFNFINKPAPFFNEDDIEDELPLKLARLTGVVNYASLINPIKDHLINWVHNTFYSMDDVQDIQYIDYAFAFTSSYPSVKGRENEVVKAIRPSLKRFKDLCENLCKVRIPAIVIKGDDDALPEIFERINSKGTQLSKYQIYAATWTKTYKLNSPKLFDLIKFNRERYESMTNDGTDIADFNPISYVKDRKLNLFEIAFALGKMLGDKYPFLFDTNKEIKDVDSLGFSLITACVGIKNSHSKSLHTAFDAVVGEQKVDIFLERILQCVDTAQSLIGKFNKFKLNARGCVGPLHTEFQIISLIANIFVARYAKYEKDEIDRIENYSLSLENSNETWNNYENQLKENAWKRYCLDILNARWKGSGDKKLDAIVFDTSYYGQTIPWNDFESGIKQWYNDTKVEKREHKRVAPPQESEKLFLALLYLPVFTAADQVDQSKYDVEHLMTKNIMKKCLDRYDGQLRLPIGSIGNLCLLPQRENRSKRDKTIYGDDVFLKKSKYTLSELENKFTFTQQKDLMWIEDQSLSRDQFEKSYMDYIDSRFNRLVNNIKSQYDRTKKIPRSKLQ